MENRKGNDRSFVEGPRREAQREDTSDRKPSQSHKKLSFLGRFKNFLSGENTGRRLNIIFRTLSAPQLNSRSSLLRRIRRALIPDLQVPPSAQTRTVTSRARTNEQPGRAHSRRRSATSNPRDSQDVNENGHRRVRRRRSAYHESRPAGRPRQGQHGQNFPRERVKAPATDENDRFDPRRNGLQGQLYFDDEQNEYHGLNVQDARAARQGTFHRQEDAHRHVSHYAVVEGPTGADNHHSPPGMARYELADRDDVAGKYEPRASRAADKHRQEQVRDKYASGASQVTIWPSGFDTTVPVPPMPDRKTTNRRAPPAPRREAERPGPSMDVPRRNCSSRTTSNRFATPSPRSSSSSRPSSKTDSDLHASQNPNPFLRHPPRRAQPARQSQHPPHRSSSLYPEDERRPGSAKAPEPSSYVHPRASGYWPQPPPPVPPVPPVQSFGPPSCLDADTVWTLNWDYKDDESKVLDGAVYGFEDSNELSRRDTLDEIYGSYFSNYQSQHKSLTEDLENADDEAEREERLQQLEELKRQFSETMRRMAAESDNKYIPSPNP